MGVDDPDGDVGFVHDDEVVDAVGFENMEDFGGEVVAADGDGVVGHEVADGSFQQSGMGLKMPPKVAVREYAEQPPARVHDFGGSGPHFGHDVQDFADQRGGRDHGHLVGAAHDLVDLEEEGAPEASAGVEAGEVFLF